MIISKFNQVSVKRVGVLFKILSQLKKKKLLIFFFHEEMGFTVFIYVILSVDLIKILGQDHNELKICIIITNI